MRSDQRLCRFNLQCHHLTSRGGRAGASILAVIPALVNLTSLPAVVGLAAALGLLVGVQEAAAAVQTLDLAGATRRRCKWKGHFVHSANEWFESRSLVRTKDQLVLEVNSLKFKKKKQPMYPTQNMEQKVCACCTTPLEHCWAFNSQIGDSVGVGSSTHVPLSSERPLGQVQTGPLGLSRHSHSHFFLSQGLVTGKHREQRERESC